MISDVDEKIEGWDKKTYNQYENLKCDYGRNLIYQDNNELRFDFKTHCNKCGKEVHKADKPYLYCQNLDPVCKGGHVV